MKQLKKGRRKIPRQKQVVRAKARKQGYMINGRILTFEQVGEEEAMIQVQQKMR